MCPKHIFEADARPDMKESALITVRPRFASNAAEDTWTRGHWVPEDIYTRGVGRNRCTLGTDNRRGDRQRNSPNVPNDERVKSASVQGN
jgi:hypothetical protein